MLQQKVMLSLSLLLENFPAIPSDISYPEDFKSVNKSIHSSLIGIVKYYLIVKNCLKTTNSQIVKTFFALTSDLDEIEGLYYNYVKSKNPYVYYKLEKATEPYLDIMKTMIMRHKSLFKEVDSTLSSMFEVD